MSKNGVYRPNGNFCDDDKPLDFRNFRMLFSRQTQRQNSQLDTWWLMPLSKWVISLVTSGLTLPIPFITGVMTHLRFVG